MAKRPALATTGIFHAPPQPEAATFAPPPTAIADLPTRPKTTGSRVGKKAVPFWMPAPAKRQLDFMVVELDTTAQALLMEAVNDLFRKYDRPPIA